MRLVSLLCGLMVAIAAPALAAASPVLMISVDGLRPSDVLEADKRGLKVPNLRRLAAEGVYATGVRNALPTVTYPNHTTLLTELGIARIADGAEIARLGGTAQANFWIDFKPGFEAGGRAGGPMIGPSGNKGTHGYFPDHPEMRATFILAGPGVAAKGSLGEIDMRDIAPTLAKVLGVSLPGADGKPLL